MARAHRHHEPAGADPAEHLRRRQARPAPVPGRGGRSCSWSTSRMPRRRGPRPTSTTCCSPPAPMPPAACGTSTARRPTASSTSPVKSAGRVVRRRVVPRPHPKSYYTNGNYGFGTNPQNAQRLVEDVLGLADPHVNFSPFDNDGDGSVEALVLICAGIGGEQSGNVNDIWSHKWGITPQTRDGKTISTYFMAPENGRVGVMAHELGHLLMGWPDLYDTDYSSAGTASWDLMAGGSWNGRRRPPCPSHGVVQVTGWLDHPDRPVERSPERDGPAVRDNAVAYKLPSASGRAPSTSCSATASKRCSTPTCPARVSSSSTSTTPRTTTPTRTTTSSTSSKRTAGGTSTSTPTGATPPIRSRRRRTQRSPGPAHRTAMATAERRRTSR